MIIGSGSIASILNDRGEFLFFAAGVSNSSELDEAKYERERNRLFEQVQIANEKGLHLVYFGSICRFYSMTRYSIHKIEMEQLIKAYCHQYTIIRIGNIWGDTNPNTFINFIMDKKAKGQFVEIRDEYKFMIHADQLRFITDNLPIGGKNEICVFDQMRKVKDCIQ